MMWVTHKCGGNCWNSTEWLSLSLTRYVANVGFIRDKTRTPNTSMLWVNMWCQRLLDPECWAHWHFRPSLDSPTSGIRLGLMGEWEWDVRRFLGFKFEWLSIKLIRNGENPGFIRDVTHNPLPYVMFGLMD